MGTSSNKPGNSLDGLLCLNALQSALRIARDADLRSREGIKELLTNPCATTETKQDPANADADRWQHCLDILVEDFLLRKNDIARLNKARREQLEDFLSNQMGSAVSLEAALQAKLGSPAQEALLLFAHETAVFHLLQILLVKRWVDQNQLDEKALAPSPQTLNWIITGFLKKNSPKGMMGRHDWSFLKQNLFSWYTPSKEAWERVRLLISTVNLSQEPSDFPARVLECMADRSRLALLGLQSPLFDAKALWRLLLEQKAHDLRQPEWDFASASANGSILMSGLRNGESINALRELSSSKELHGVWAYTNSDLERYLSEISILWSSASEIPQLNIHPRKILRERTGKSVPLFDEKARLPFQAQLAACFPENGFKELEDASVFLEQLREHGLLLVVSDCFWPTDSSDAAQKLRDCSLRLASVRLIVDLRQLTGSSGEHIPKSLCILEKCSSKELRDSSRPQILRMRGHINKIHADSAWAMILESLRQESAPGEVNTKSIQGSDSVKLESMAAAASQQQLKSAAWLTLSDPFFYELSGRLRRLPSRAFTLGSVLRWKPGISMPTQRGVILQERDSKALQAIPATEEITGAADLIRFLFLPDSTLVENPLFFSAQVHSAPVQFWFRLELEQSLNAKSTKGTKQPERQTEQRLKLMPLVRLFEPGTLLPVSVDARAYASLDEARSTLARAFKSGLGMVERQQLHQIVLSLENSIRQNIEVCREFTRHLFPELDIQRWSLPNALPEIAPSLAFDIFRHLDKSPLMQHPAVQVTKLRPVHDFKVSNIVLNEIQAGAFAELLVYHGIDPVLRLSGPALLLKAAASELEKRVGRPWSESSERLHYPTDFALVQTQLREVVRSIQQQLQVTRDCIAVMDQLFCCLFGLASSFEDEKARQTIRHHLSPEEAKIVVSFQKPVVFTKREDFESPTGFLQ